MKRFILAIWRGVLCLGWRRTERSDWHVSICTLGRPLTAEDRQFIESAMAHIRDCRERAR